MIDCIHLAGITVDTIIGVYSHELKIKQPVIIDLNLFSSFLKASKSDDINDAVDYKDLTESLIEFVSESRIHLLEKLANDIASWLLKKYPFEKVQVTVNKPNALTTANVGVSIERQKPTTS